jgi:hypothetical protein
VTEVYPELRDGALLSFPCFEIETHSSAGLRGEAIFDEAGELFGLLWSGHEDDPIAYGVFLWPVVRYTH